MTVPAAAIAETFTGFGPKALPFFKALDFHQDRQWFQDNRALYDSDVHAPMAAFVTALGRACEARGLPLRGTPKTSIFRIHRDVRFAKDKRPYKTHAGAVLTRSGQKSDPGLFYIHIAPEGCFCAAGFYDLSPVRLHALRAAMAGEPARFLAMAQRLAEAGLVLDPQWSLKRAPREAAGVSDPRILSALRLTAHVVRRPLSETAIHGLGLVDLCADFIAQALPLLDYGWGILERLPPARP